MISALRCRTKHAWGDRGATIVEYAMLVALIIVVSIGAITKIQDRGEQRLSASDDRITPVADGQYYSSGGSPSSIPPSSSSSIPPTPVHLASSPTIVVQNDGSSKWTVTVTFKLLDGSNNGVIGARLDAGFSDGSGPATAVNCSTTTSSGLCTVQFVNINDNKSPVTLAVTGISGGSFSWSPQAGGEGQLTIGCSPPLNSSCD
jgi:Flp pilus assembly pilin Flp